MTKNRFYFITLIAIEISFLIILGMCYVEFYFGIKLIQDHNVMQTLSIILSYIAISIKLDKKN